ncbi:MAG: hypothetical protein JW822_14160 [Spirochaetales bacterium]|nr:hypothetical protein [Spirochaetales bacterium]
MMKISGSAMKYNRILYIVLFSFLLISWNDNDKINTFINLLDTKSAQELFDEYYNQFMNKAIKIEYEYILIKNNQRTILNTGLIYCDKHRLVVRKDLSDYTGDKNYVVLDDGIYCWINNSKKGYILRRKENDINGLLSIVLDISYFKRFFLQGVIDDREQFTISGDDDNGIIITHTQSGLKTGLLLNPIWLQDMYGPVNNGEQQVIRYKRPTKITDIPSEHLIIPEDVQFEEKNATYESEMILM